MSDKIDIFAPIQIEGHPGYTIRRVGVLLNGKYLWQLFRNGEMIADIDEPETASRAQLLAAIYIAKYEKE